jgi:isopenicillin N synthase-like dioxygenase
VNHGVSSSLLEEVKLEIQEFFNLPMSEKKKFWQSSEHMEGFGQAFVVSEDQKLDWADMFYMTTLPKHSRMPHLFPQLPLPFRFFLSTFASELFMPLQSFKIRECIIQNIIIFAKILNCSYNSNVEAMMVVSC